jgi:hypothetical protein
MEIAIAINGLELQKQLQMLCLIQCRRIWHFWKIIGLETVELHVTISTMM